MAWAEASQRSAEFCLEISSAHTALLAAEQRLADSAFVLGKESADAVIEDLQRRLGELVCAYNRGVQILAAETDIEVRTAVEKLLNSVQSEIAHVNRAFRGPGQTSPASQLRLVNLLAIALTPIEAIRLAWLHPSLRPWEAAGIALCVIGAGVLGLQIARQRSPVKPSGKTRRSTSPLWPSLEFRVRADRRPA